MTELLLKIGSVRGHPSDAPNGEPVLSKCPGMYDEQDYGTDYALWEIAIKIKPLLEKIEATLKGESE